MVKVFVVIKFRKHEDTYICKVFGDCKDAVDYCNKWDGQDGYTYQWDVLEVE